MNQEFLSVFFATCVATTCTTGVLLGLAARHVAKSFAKELREADARREEHNKQVLSVLRAARAETAADDREEDILEKGSSKARSS